MRAAVGSMCSISCFPRTTIKVIYCLVGDNLVPQHEPQEAKAAAAHFTFISLIPIVFGAKNKSLLSSLTKKGGRSTFWHTTDYCKLHHLFFYSRSAKDFKIISFEFNSLNYKCTLPLWEPDWHCSGRVWFRWTGVSHSRFLRDKVARFLTDYYFRAP